MLSILAWCWNVNLLLHNVYCSLQVLSIFVIVGITFTMQPHFLRLLMELSNNDPALSRWGSDSSRGAQVEAEGSEPSRPPHFNHCRGHSDIGEATYQYYWGLNRDSWWRSRSNVLWSPSQFFGSMPPKTPCKIPVTYHSVLENRIRFLYLKAAVMFTVKL